MMILLLRIPSHHLVVVSEVDTVLIIDIRRSMEIAIPTGSVATVA